MNILSSYHLTGLTIALIQQRVCSIIQIQGQPPRGAPEKKCSESMQQIYWRTPTRKYDFNIAYRYGCSPLNLLHIFRTPFRKNTSGRLLLQKMIVGAQNRSSRTFMVAQRCSVKRYSQKFEKFIGKHLCQSLFFNDVTN